MTFINFNIPTKRASNVQKTYRHMAETAVSNPLLSTYTDHKFKNKTVAKKE